MRTALLISPRPNVIEDARRAGYQEIFVFIKKNQINNDIFNLADKVFVFEWDHYYEALQYAKMLHSANPIYKIYGFGEYSVQLAAYLSESLGLQGISVKSVQLATDKHLMRDVLNKVDNQYVFYEVVKTKNDLLKLKGKIPYPFILKPISGAGSMNVCKVSSDEDFKRFECEYKESSGIIYICEEFLKGKEISVEAISFNGKHKIIGITEKYTTGSPHFIETGHVFPYCLEEVQQKQVSDSITAILNSIGHNTGLTHTELILTDSGPKVVETHVRPGGDGITDLVMHSTGISMFHALFMYDLYEIEEFPVHPAHVTSNQFFFFEEGIISKVEGIEQIRENPQVIAINLSFKEGDSLKTPTDSTNRHGNAILIADDREGINKLVDQVHKTIRVEVELI
ncbi:Biotin carboxylase [Bacillus sp. OV322]|uniref:ATP-grasp domain-containing protein n=1 Tax=Bacillus sp. OV322 TaxID=1882764 RepID=UPI0008EC943E|nr:ATP-grasp domain-containing protein [Bacillus sp. OV322]SFC35286.1 Biotin carboxylase [Bacillus sp. OV322]